MFVPVLDQLTMQLKKRFSDEQVGLMKEIALFSSGAMKSGCVIRSADIDSLTRTYGLDAEAIVTEYTEFCIAFNSLNLTQLCESYHMQLIDKQQSDDDSMEVDSPDASVGRDIDTDETVSTADDGSEQHKSDSEDEDPVDEVCDVQRKKWVLQNFIIPLKACYQLPGYPHLLRLYWILCTLPVSSCSAERALSRLRIIKNRLR